MQTRHTVIDSPLGELTLAANDDALTGLYFPHPLARAHGGPSGPVR
jgi:methylated-DNA-[protein]-cysteine S-methyltransferase